jgi:hypothetical protein
MLCDRGKVDRVLTLQKSMLLTPLLPSAGPTGGEGDAWPAPTMSLTITSDCIARFAIVNELGTRFATDAKRSRE